MDVLVTKFDSKPTAVLRNGLTLPLGVLHPDFIQQVTRSLTYYLPPTEYDPERKMIEGFQIRKDRTGDYLIIPRRLAERPAIGDNFNVLDSLSDGRELSVASEPIKLRDERQYEFVRSVWEEISHGRSAYGVAAPGVGKTVMAIELCRRLNRSVAVVVHKDFLADQWIARLRQFWPNVRIGRCQQKQCDTGWEYDVVICMVQSLSRHGKYPDSFWSSFGITVYDESHRVGAEHWNPVMYAFSSRVQLMLSATPRRKDGMHKLQFLQSSKPTVVVSMPDRVPVIHSRLTGTELPAASYKFRGRANWGRMITRIALHPQRNALILSDLVKAAAAGRRILVISERRKQLDLLQEMLTKAAPSIVTDQYVGGRSKEGLAVASTAQVIFTTYQLTNEGLDIPALDTLFVATPRSDMVQAVGRILRDMDGKKESVVVDYLDKVPELYGLAVKRQKSYITCGYDLRKPRGRKLHA